MPFRAEATSAQDVRPPLAPLIIEAGWALVTDAGDSLSLRRDASIVVEKGAISEIRSGRLPGTHRRVDARRLLVVPGFISGHTHVCSGTPTRGIIEGGRSYARTARACVM